MKRGVDKVVKAVQMIYCSCLDSAVTKLKRKRIKDQQQ